MMYFLTTTTPVVRFVLFSSRARNICSTTDRNAMGGSSSSSSSSKAVSQKQKDKRAAGAIVVNSHPLLCVVYLNRILSFYVSTLSEMLNVRLVAAAFRDTIQDYPPSFRWLEKDLSPGSFARASRLLARVLAHDKILPPPHHLSEWFVRVCAVAAGDNFISIPCCREDVTPLGCAIRGRNLLAVRVMLDDIRRQMAVFRQSRRAASAAAGVAATAPSSVRPLSAAVRDILEAGLACAAHDGCVEIAELLLDLDASASSANEYVIDADAAPRYVTTMFGIVTSPLHAAIMNNRAAVLELFLSPKYVHRFDLNRERNRESILVAERMGFLVAEQRGFDDPMRSYTTPLHILARAVGFEQSGRIMALMLATGRCRLDQRSVGWTELAECVRWGNTPGAAAIYDHVGRVEGRRMLRDWRTIVSPVSPGFDRYLQQRRMDTDPVAPTAAAGGGLQTLAEVAVASGQQRMAAWIAARLAEDNEKRAVI
jgi:hypothetical protein